MVFLQNDVAFSNGFGAVLGTGRQPLAWVAIEDVVAAICFFTPTR